MSSYPEHMHMHVNLQHVTRHPYQLYGISVSVGDKRQCECQYPGYLGDTQVASSSVSAGASSCVLSGSTTSVGKPAANNLATCTQDARARIYNI